MDDLKHAVRADGSYPRIWEALIISDRGDELRLEQQEMRADARRENLRLGTVTLQLLYEAARQAE